MYAESISSNVGAMTHGLESSEAQALRGIRFLVVHLNPHFEYYNEIFELFFIFCLFLIIFPNRRHLFTILLIFSLMINVLSGLWSSE